MLRFFRVQIFNNTAIYYEVAYGLFATYNVEIADEQEQIAQH